MWIDRPNRHFNPAAHTGEWQAIDVPAAPFAGATFYAPTEPGSGGAPTIDGCNATAYGWALRDVLAQELLPSMFAVIPFVAFLHTRHDIAICFSAVNRNEV